MCLAMIFICALLLCWWLKGVVAFSSLEPFHLLLLVLLCACECTIHTHTHIRPNSHDPPTTNTYIRLYLLASWKLFLKAINKGYMQLTVDIKRLTLMGVARVALFSLNLALGYLLTSVATHTHTHNPVLLYMTIYFFPNIPSYLSYTL